MMRLVYNSVQFSGYIVPLDLLIEHCLDKESDNNFLVIKREETTRSHLEHGRKDSLR